MQSDTRSQGMYVHNLTTSNMYTFDINNSAKFDGNIKKGGATLCSTTIAKFKYNDMASKGLYTKTTTQPLTASEQTLKIQKNVRTQLEVKNRFHLELTETRVIIQII